MNKLTLTGLLALALTGSGGGAQGAAVIAMDHNGPEAAEAFHFATVPAPRRNSALGAIFQVIDGRPSAHGGGPEVLHDGQLPDESDQPEANFFFADGQDGGRFTVDLHKSIPIKEVATYSRHADTRAPQVYKLYGSDGSAAGFDPKPQAGIDPAQCGWKLLASVDTRPRFKVEGGSCGVSITDADGILGTCRYLLFAVSVSETEDAFGNTFFSEIDVLNRDEPTDGTALSTAPSGKRTTEYDQKGLHLTIKCDDPTFDPKETERLAQTFFTVYPKMMAEYNPNASKRVLISIEQRYHGVAATEADHIHINPVWFHQHPEDIDVVTHEGMHIVQAYRQWDPAWLREGIADYARYEFGVNNPAARWNPPDYNPRQSYQDAYQVTARFLVWLEKRVKPGIVKTMDQALRSGTYSAESWNKATGKSVDQLWSDYGKNPVL